MHRSGTSLLGSLLQRLGVALPGFLTPGNQHNPDGFFERRDVVDLQEGLLKALDRFWAGPRGAEHLPEHWRAHPATLRCERELRRLLKEAAIRQTGPWAIKDPRTSLLLPLWRQLCTELGIPLQLVLAVRDPNAVVASVMARDERIAGMTWWRAQQLWWRFNTAVVQGNPSPGEPPPLVVHYEGWFSDPYAQAAGLVRRLGLPEPSQTELADVKAGIRPEHRHQFSLPPGAPPLDHRLHQLHHWLLHQTQLSNQPPIRLGTLRPRRTWRQELAHRLDWIWLLGSPLLPPGSLRKYRRGFLQGDVVGLLASPSWITRQNPELLRHHRDPLSWYQRIGWKLGVSPHPLLQPQKLWSQLAVRKEVVGLYRREALHDDLHPHPCFDPVHYRHQCLDADCRPLPTPLEHYLLAGWQAGLSPHPAVDPLWVQRRHGLPGEPLTALIMIGADVCDPGLTHPCGNLYGAALGDDRCANRLPPALVDLVKLWNSSGLWPAECWLQPDALRRPLPSFALFGPESSALFAAGMQLQDMNLCLPALPCRWFCDSSPLPWRVEQLFVNSNVKLYRNAVPGAERLQLAADQAVPGEWLINFTWPASHDLNRWIQVLRDLAGVLDPDPQRVAFLQLFGVPARHQPFSPLIPQPDEIEPLLLHAQLQLGLPDPRWFAPDLALTVLGSSGQAQERRWGMISLRPSASGLLLLPRLPQLVLATLMDVKALQAWLDVLLANCPQVLWLEQLADGACQPTPGLASSLVKPSAEVNLLTTWEERVR